MAQRWIMVGGLSLVLLCSILGCASTTTNLIKEKGIVAWNYTSQLPEVTAGEPSIPGTLRLLDIGAAKKRFTNRCWVSFVAAVPILSATLPYSTECKNCFRRKSAELEQLLLEELRKSRVASEVTYGNAQRDFDLRGEINTDMAFGPNSPLGFLSLSPIAWLVRDQFMRGRNAVDGHFELISAASGKTVFVKDYAEEFFYTYGFVEPATNEEVYSFGGELVPAMFKKLITDLKALPDSTWTE